MNYLKGMLAGIASAILSLVLFATAMLGFVAWRIEVPETGVTAVIVRPELIFTVVIMAFALSFWLSVRRHHHRVRAHVVRFVIVPLALAALGMIVFLWMYFRPTVEYVY